MARVTGYKRPRKYGSRAKTRTRAQSRPYRWPKGKYTRLRKVARSLVPRIARNPFPKTVITRHRYVETVTLPAGAVAGATAFYIFRANGIYDPNYSGTGHQPLYRDEMAARYTNYSVLNSYISVVFDQQSTIQKHYGVYLQDSNGSLQSDPQTLCEQYNTRGPLVGYQRNSPLIIRKSFDAVKEMRTSSVRALMSDDTYKTPVGSDPSSSKVVRYFVIMQGPAKSTETASAETITVKITYVVAWQDPLDATGS